MRTEDSARSDSCHEAFLISGIPRATFAACALGQKLRWKRKPTLTSWKLMNSKLSSR